VVGLKTNKLDGYFFCVIVMIKKKRKFYDCFFTCMLSLEKTTEVPIKAKMIDENIVKIRFYIMKNL